MLEITQENFASEVLEAKVPVLVDFWAPWCGPCRMQGPIVEAFAENHSEVKAVKCNVDENMELAQQFRIMNIPTLMVFKDGKLVNTAIGLHDESGLEQLVR
ncbi:MAG: thioredoxin [Phascolarctobacterium sp.]|nr:thioredoxin [Phascolarctobacterium sp.]